MEFFRCPLPNRIKCSISGKIWCSAIVCRFVVHLYSRIFKSLFIQVCRKENLRLRKRDKRLKKHFPPAKNSAIEKHFKFVGKLVLLTAFFLLQYKNTESRQFVFFAKDCGSWILREIYFKRTKIVQLKNSARLQSKHRWFSYALFVHKCTCF